MLIFAYSVKAVRIFMLN